MASARANAGGFFFFVFAVFFQLFSLLQLAHGQATAPAPSPMSSDGSAIDQGIAYALMLVALLNNNEKMLDMGKKNSLISSCSSIVTRSIKRRPLHRWLPRRLLLFAIPRVFSSGYAPRSAPVDAVDLSHIHRYLVENFPSLYTGGSFSSSCDDSLSYDADDDDDDICRLSHISRPAGNVSPRRSLPPPYALRASERFFVPSPSAAAGSSLVEEARISAASADSSFCSSTSSSGGSRDSSFPYSSSSSSPSPTSSGTAVEKFSKEPYDDFVRSMTAMVEEHRQVAGSGSVEGEFMEELLFSYLELNHRSVYKDILRAFADVSASLRRGCIDK